MSAEPIDQLAEATYRAMCRPTPAVELAQILLGARTAAERCRLLDSADRRLLEAALAYAAAPEVTRERDRRLEWMRADPRRVAALRTYYSTHIPQFIHDWALTFDPRLRGEKLIPFKLYPRQWELAEALLDSYRTGEDLTLVKSRDSGASWLAMCIAVSLAIFEPGFTCLVGSQLEAKVDRSGTNANTLFGKARMFLQYLPPEFRGEWSPKNDLYMRLFWPHGSVLFGQAGEAIGRSERASVALLDEYAHIEHPDKVDEALTSTAGARWYISTPCGSDNPFAERVRDGKTKVFVYGWRDDPRKTDEWAAKEIERTSQRKFDQEFGCSFNVGAEDQMFTQAHLDALIDAHVALKIEPTGRKFGGFDPGGGGDASAFAIAEGPVVTYLEQWASSPNLKKELRRAFEIADRFNITEFNADCCGIGNGLESIADELNAERLSAGHKKITLQPFKASEAPLNPEYPCVPGSKTKAKDYYPNKKSQAYDWNRFRARVTYQMVQGETGDPEHVLSISSQIPAAIRNKFLLEYASITCSETAGGKLSVDKYGTAGASPNLADAATLATAPRRPVRMKISDIALDAIAGAGPMPGSAAWDAMAGARGRFGQ